jgi:hypothetical protein
VGRVVGHRYQTVAKGSGAFSSAQSRRVVSACRKRERCRKPKQLAASLGCDGADTDALACLRGLSDMDEGASDTCVSGRWSPRQSRS